MTRRLFLTGRNSSAGDQQWWFGVPLIQCSFPSRFPVLPCWLGPGQAFHVLGGVRHQDGTSLFLHSEVKAKNGEYPLGIPHPAPTTVEGLDPLGIVLHGPLSKVLG